jgi:hypothetical protein
MSSYFSPEWGVPAAHLLRSIMADADQILQDLTAR